MRAVASSNAAPHLQRQRAPACLRRVARLLSLRWSPKLAHRTATARKKRGLSPTQCSLGGGHGQTATGAARRARSSGLECSASSQRELRRRTCAASTRRLFGVGGRILHVAPRARAEEQRPLASAVLFHRQEPTATSAARRAHAARLSAAPPLKRQRAQARLRLVAHGASLALEPEACTSHHERALKERDRSPERCLNCSHRKTITSATRRARVSSSSAAPPPQRQRVQQPRLRLARRATLA